MRITLDFINDYMAYPPSQPGREDIDELMRFVQTHSTIVVAKAVTHRSAFTASKAFIYSDWDFEVSRLFKNDSAEAMQAGSIITVTRPGGSLVSGNIKYVAEDKTFPAFHDGDVSALFLTPVGESSHSFRAFSGECFLLSGPTVSRIDDYQRHSPLTTRVQNESPDDFLALVEKAVVVAGKAGK